MSRYQDTLDYIYAMLPMYQREGKSAFKKDLTNIKLLSEALGNPQDSLKCFHIAGTNGKGTVSHLIAYILQTQGYKVGLYTSPHYKDFRERIKVNGKMASKQYVTSFVNDNKHLIESIKPSFFEITVAMAMAYFQKEKVDYAVIEVGLGGRLDSTNIITPELSIITNISYDHMDMLGDTLEKIAFEKAGIIKPKIPVIIGESQEETFDVFLNQATLKEAPIYWADKELSLEDNGKEYCLNLHNKEWLYVKDLPISGPYQSKNIITAFHAMQYWANKSNIQISWQKVIHHFDDFRKMVNYMGRWQIISHSPTVMVDSAHNEGGIVHIKNHFDTLDVRKLHIVCGFVNDKDLSKVLPLFPSEALYYFAKANIPRGMHAAELKQKALAYGLKGKAYTSVKKALSVAKSRASEEDFIFVGGSIFVVAEVL